MRTSTVIFDTMNKAVGTEIYPHKIGDSIASIIFHDDCKVLQHIARGHSCPVICKVSIEGDDILATFSVSGNPQKFAALLGWHPEKRGTLVLKKTYLMPVSG